MGRYSQKPPAGLCSRCTFPSSTSGGHRVFYHHGENPGYRSVNAWFPDDGVRLAVLSNEDATGLGPVIHDLIRTAFPGNGVR
jgi:hypothetical protein